MKSHLQKQRYNERQPVYSHNKDLTNLVKCPKCKRHKMTKENLNKYGQCYNCKFDEDVRKR